MKCDGRFCKLKELYCTPEQQEEWVKNCDGTVDKCPRFSPKIEQKSPDYYEGFWDAAHLIMATLKAMKG